ncbi:Uncharacterised protein [Mycobacteroides abscessus subsp. abscessus]|nr:Uncharacterised protein [Mycobacteroides abscessus subsp. abscessus]
MVVCQRTFPGYSETRSRNASTGCTPRASATCPNDLPTTDSSGQPTISVSYMSRFQATTPYFCAISLRNLRR